VAFSLEPKTMKNGTRIAFAVDPTGYKIELIHKVGERGGKPAADGTQDLSRSILLC